MLATRFSGCPTPDHNLQNLRMLWYCRSGCYGTAAPDAMVLPLRMRWYCLSGCVIRGVRACMRSRWRRAPFGLTKHFEVGCAVHNSESAGEPKLTCRAVSCADRRASPWPCRRVHAPDRLAAMLPSLAGDEAAACPPRQLAPVLVASPLRLSPASKASSPNGPGPHKPRPPRTEKAQDQKPPAPELNRTSTRPDDTTRSRPAPVTEDTVPNAQRSPTSRVFSVYSLPVPASRTGKKQKQTETQGDPVQFPGSDGLRLSEDGRVALRPVFFLVRRPPARLSSPGPTCKPRLYNWDCNGA
jgi:hypothetical protein